MQTVNYEEIVRKCYRDLLNREPDQDGFNHYVGLLKKNEIDNTQLINIFKNSTEYKSVHDVGTVSHPIEIDPSTPIDFRMKKEWDARAKQNPLFAIATGLTPLATSVSKLVWESGINDTKAILGLDTPRFEKICYQKDQKKMRILEIGCGIGRLLIPMSKIFGETIGVDVSSKMAELGQKYVADTPNCKILESNGINLSLFPDNHFDFCYSYVVFQHIPEKKIVQQYIEEVSRVLKPECLFRFQVRGIVNTKPKGTTWDGVQFNSEEIRTTAKKNNFEILEESDFKQEYFWLTFRAKK